MDALPPKPVRRLVLAPLIFALCLVLIALSPVLVLAAVIADLFLPGSWRTTRLVAFGVVYVAMEVTGLIAMVVLWAACGLGRSLDSERARQLHYRFMTWWLKVMHRAVALLFGLKIRIEDRPAPQPGPVLVFCRHAGPGNSLMLIGTMMIGYQRRPRIVMLAKLQWDPLFDIMGNRLPNRFIRHDRKNSARYIEAIGELARGLGERDAFVLFPEGKDFTQRVRARAIARLRAMGFSAHADRAEKMVNVLPPRHRGPLAAITSAPEADVVFVAHSVLEEIGTFKELWRRLPLREPIRARYWRLPPAEVPSSEPELIEWLYAWWERIDAWIEQHKTPQGPSPENVAG